jgi:hypothetical protein
MRWILYGELYFFLVSDEFNSSRISYNNMLHLTAIPLRFIAAGEPCRYAK